MDINMTLNEREMKIWQEKAVEVGLDLRMGWGNWDSRCARVDPLEQRSLLLRQQISTEVAHLAGGAAEAPTVQYSVLMHLGEPPHPLLRNQVEVTQNSDTREESELRF